MQATLDSLNDAINSLNVTTNSLNVTTRQSANELIALNRQATESADQLDAMKRTAKTKESAGYYIQCDARYIQYGILNSLFLSGIKFPTESYLLPKFISIRLILNAILEVGFFRSFGTIALTSIFLAVAIVSLPAKYHKAQVPVGIIGAFATMLQDYGLGGLTTPMFEYFSECFFQ